MNYETRKQLLAMRFSCALCGYGSKLDLRECPGCGRLKSDEIRKTGAPEKAARPAAIDGVFESFANALPIAESYLFVCEQCRYQTRRQIGECPECGRRKFAKFDVPARGDGGDLRFARAASNRSQIGTFLLIISISFFIAAFLTFIRFGSTGDNSRDRIVTVIIFLVFGFGSVVAGLIVKNKD